MKKKHRIWIDQFLVNCSHLNKSEFTIKNYRADLVKFAKWYESGHNSHLNKINGRIISQYKDFLTIGGKVDISRISNKKKKRAGIFSKLKQIIKRSASSPPLLLEQTPLAVNSRRRHLSTLKNFFEFLKQSHEDHSRLFKINPVKSKIHAIRLKEVDVNHTPILKKEDWNALNEVVYRLRDRLILYLLYWGGLRLGELINLKVKNFDMKSKTLCFERKGGDIHTLRPQKADSIFRLFKSYLSYRERDAVYLFINKKGLPLSQKTLYNTLMRFFRKAGCSDNLTPHSFRKACATNLYIRRKDLLLVRDYLNHKDAQVTQTYIDKKTLYAQSSILVS
ncbi:MAG: tyrosine-type recombinase/integrase [Halobacteriovoraceae bacterium]|nr:tyrosine-type recombinase/integrase [Halobacteriovoraceae bacterium]